MSGKLHIIPVLFLLISFASCNADNELDSTSLDPSVSYGTVIYFSGSQREPVDDNYYIVRDDGGQMIIDIDHTRGSDVYNGQRILFNYNITGKEDSGNQQWYRIALYALKDIPSKGLIWESDSNGANENLEVMKDPVKLQEAWFGGKYLNVVYDVYIRPQASWTPVTELICREGNPDGDYVFLILSHDSRGDIPTVEDYTAFRTERRIISFDISSIIPEGEESVEVRFAWMEFKDNWDETILRYMRERFSLNLDRYGLQYIQ